MCQTTRRHAKDDSSHGNETLVNLHEVGSSRQYSLQMIISSVTQYENSLLITRSHSRQRSGWMCSRLLPFDRHSGWTNWMPCYAVKECCCGKLSVCNLTCWWEFVPPPYQPPTKYIWIRVRFRFMMVISSLIHCQGARSQEIALSLNPLNPIEVAGVLCLACGRQPIVIAAVQQTFLPPRVNLQCTLASKVLYSYCVVAYQGAIDNRNSCSLLHHSYSSMSEVRPSAIILRTEMDRLQQLLSITLVEW
jgi:hypothetical protein